VTRHNISLYLVYVSTLRHRWRPFALILIRVLLDIHHLAQALEKGAENLCLHPESLSCEKHWVYETSLSFSTYNFPPIIRFFLVNAGLGVNAFGLCRLPHNAFSLFTWISSLSLSLSLCLISEGKARITRHRQAGVSTVEPQRFARTRICGLLEMEYVCLF